MNSDWSGVTFKGIMVAHGVTLLVLILHDVRFKIGEVSFKGAKGHRKGGSRECKGGAMRFK